MTDTTLAPAIKPVKRPFLSPLNKRRWQNFKANKRGYWSLWIFLFLLVAALCAEFIANDRPILVSYKGELLMPVLSITRKRNSAVLCRHRLSRPGDTGRDRQ